VSSPAERERIARFLGVAIGVAERRVARLACAGGNDVARRRGRYLGPPTCAAAQSLGGGGKVCAWGCLGLGDCERACRFDAIHLSRHDLPVVDAARCTACGDCVTACPRDLFRLLPEALPLVVRCSSEERGDLALEACEVACTACGRCAMDEPSLVRMGPRSLPVVAYDRPHEQRRAIERCPTGAIVWVEGPRDLKGGAAPRLLRRQALPREASRVHPARDASDNPPPA
jgi:ferredoxin